jgi:hypothetical protein
MENVSLFCGYFVFKDLVVNNVNKPDFTVEYYDLTLIFSLIRAALPRRSRM